MLARGLREQAYAVDVAYDGEAALEQAHVNSYDLIVLDIMLPRKDGLQVCRELRAKGSTVPVLMLTARDSVEDRILGLDTGADDYLVKPFETITVADINIETRARRVWRGRRRVELTAKEYALLEYLASRAGEVVGRADIAEHVWDDNFDPFSNLIEVYVQRLRRKVDHNQAVKLLHTRRSEGYSLAAGGEGADA
jgi:DNA-binding response OmpR family regulator